VNAIEKSKNSTCGPIEKSKKSTLKSPKISTLTERKVQKIDIEKSKKSTLKSPKI